MPQTFKQPLFLSSFRNETRCIPRRKPVSRFLNASFCALVYYYIIVYCNILYILYYIKLIQAQLLYSNTVIQIHIYLMAPGEVVAPPVVLRRKTAAALWKGISSKQVVPPLSDSLAISSSQKFVIFRLVWDWGATF